MNVLEKIKSYLLNYTYIEPLALGESFSTNILVRRNLSGSIWAGKISRPLPIEITRSDGRRYVRSIDFRDLDARAMLGFRLARIAGLKSLKARVVSIRRIEGFIVAQVEHERLDNNIFLTNYSGQSLANYLKAKGFSTFEESDIINKEEVVGSFVFNLWIGNYDNKDRDYLVNENRELISIDYHLLGPGFKDDPTLALGSWGEAFDIESPTDTGWCVGDGALLQYLRKNTGDWRPFANAISNIKSISKLRIKFAMRGLRFYRQGTKENIDDMFYRFLIERRRKLEKTIRAWIRAGCPLTPLPKENGIV